MFYMLLTDDYLKHLLMVWQAESQAHTEDLDLYFNEELDSTFSEVFLVSTLQFDLILRLYSQTTAVFSPCSEPRMYEAH